MWLDYPTLGGSTWGYSSTVNWIRRVVWFPRVALRQLTLIQLLQDQNISSRHLHIKSRTKSSPVKRGTWVCFPVKTKSGHSPLLERHPSWGCLRCPPSSCSAWCPSWKSVESWIWKNGNNEICWKCGSETWKSMRNCSLIKSSSSGWRGRTVGHKWLLGVAGCTDITVW